MNERIKENLIKLSNAVCIGKIREAANIAKAELLKYAAVSEKDRNVTGVIGEGEYTIMLDAHIDEVGFVVTDIDSEGFLTVSACGGIDLRHLPSRRVVIHAKETVTGVFCSVPPHIKGEEEIKFDDISNFKIDSLLGKKARDVIAPGDYVTFCESATALGENSVTGKSLDDRAGVVCLIEVAARLKDKKLPVKVAFALTGEEELGCRGAKTAAYTVVPNEAIAVDVTFGSAPDVEKTEAKELSGGAAIGVSPVLDREISDKLVKTAKENGIMYDTEIMSGRTGTDGDVISVSRGGVKTGVLSIPIRNMHSPAEVVDLNDINAVCDILEKYILSGGIKNV